MVHEAKSFVSDLFIVYFSWIKNNKNVLLEWNVLIFGQGWFLYNLVKRKIFSWEMSYHSDEKPVYDVCPQ